MEFKISVMNIIHDTIVDGEGFRTSVYCAGCSHCCDGCHNQDSWNIKNGSWKTIIEIYDEIVSNSLTNVTFTGGDPMYQAEAFYYLAKRIKETTNKTIWCYTGFIFEELTDKWQKELLCYVDVLVDGKFNKREIEGVSRFKGSLNQRIIDVKKSLERGDVVIWE